MSEKYVTKMGWEIERRTTGETYLRANGENRLSGWDFLSVPDMINLREYFLAERDKEVPYSVVEGEYIIARFLERELAEKFVKKMGHEYMRILPEEPKPWHDAKPGEVWVVTGDGIEELVMTVFESIYGGFRFRQNDEVGTVWALDTPSITDGRRIWPESGSDNNE